MKQTNIITIEKFNEVSLSPQQEGKGILNDNESQTKLPLANLPPLLEKVINVFVDEDERKLIMYSTIVALSGIFTRVYGSYKQKTCYTNMGFMALAPPASGKSIMMYPKKLLSPIQQYVLKESNDQLKEYNRLPKKSRQKGIPPPFKVVFIPGNTSSSKLIQHLSDNSSHTPAIMMESEMDTVSITNASDFGNYSDIVRKALENEPVSITRRKDNEYINVECPKIAIVLSGTPGQVFKFINNKEDGLLSRFLIMNYCNNNGWQSVGPCPGCINLTEHFRTLSIEYFNMWEFIHKEDLEIKLSNCQWSSLDSYCEGKYKEISEFHHQDATSLIKRHGNMIFRICMVLTTMRKYEHRLSQISMTCFDEDFETALYLINESLYSALDLYEQLPDVKYPRFNNKEALYKELPNEFTRGEALIIGKKLSISVRSVDRYLNTCLEKNILSQISKGNYCKSMN